MIELISKDVMTIEEGSREKVCDYCRNCTKDETTGNKICKQNEKIEDVPFYGEEGSFRFICEKVVFEFR